MPIKKQKKYALISVYNKEGIVSFAKKIISMGYDIISTGGTAKTLGGEGITVVPVQDITGNPEALDGRMKTISFQIEGGILADRRKKEHRKQVQELHLPDIRIVVCNLYPFSETIATKGITLTEAIEQIDVGGPTMIRAAAKNLHNVIVVVEPNDYELVAGALKKGDISVSLRQHLAAKAFSHLSYYDAQIARYLERDEFPAELTLPLSRVMPLRYGDNPDQRASFYRSAGVDSPLAHLMRLAGRELSATNITDIDAGIKAVRLFKGPACVVIKHNSPCGIALGSNAEESLSRALEADPESAFGGVVVMNRAMTLQGARVIASFKEAGRGNMDIVGVPGIDPKALALLTEVRKTTGVYTFGPLSSTFPERMQVRMVGGGAVIQTENNPEANYDKWEIVTVARPTKKQMALMKVGWSFASRVRSNTVLVIDGDLPMTRGIGTGQTSRVLSTKIALERASAMAAGGILVSDSFFPFDDSVKLAAQKGIAGIVQEGGSVNDTLSITAADAAHIPMVFTHQRVFWH